MKKVLLVFIFVVSSLFAYRPQPMQCGSLSVLKQLNQIIIDDSNAVLENKDWTWKLNSLSTYTIVNFKTGIEAINYIANAERILINKNFSTSLANNNDTCLYPAVKISQDIKKRLKRSPDKLENMYYLLLDFKKLMNIHNIYMNKLLSNMNNMPEVQNIYLKTYLNAQKYKFLRKLTLQKAYMNVKSQYNQGFDKFVSDLKQHTYWFLRYFGKSVKFAEKIENNSI